MTPENVCEKFEKEDICGCCVNITILFDTQAKCPAESERFDPSRNIPENCIGKQWKKV